MKSHRTPAPGSGQTDRILAVVGATRDVPNGMRYDLEIANTDDRIPAVFMVPHAHEPLPAALLLHGFGSRKERMIDTLGEALVQHHVAALAVDLPMHGGRAAPGALQSANPMELFGTWSTAVNEARIALQFLATHEAIDAVRLAIVGYSLGAV